MATRKIHICILGWFSGGTGSLIKTVLGRLSRRSYKISIVDFSNARAYGETFMDFLTVDDRVFNVPRQRLLPLPNFLKLVRVIRKLAPDILHGYGEISMAYLMRSLKTIVQKPCLVTITRIKSEYPFLTVGEETSILKIIDRWKSSILSSLDGLICMNQYVKNRLIEAGVDVGKISVIHFLPDEQYMNIGAEPANWNVSPDTKIVLFWGSGATRWGLHIFLSSIDKVLKHVPNSYFLIMVRGFTDGKIERLAYSLARNNRRLKIVSKHLQPHTISSVLLSADVVVLPFCVNPMEPPMTLVESMYLGRPVVTTNVGGNNEVIEDFYNGRLVNPEANQLAKAIIDLLQDDRKRREIGKRARRSILERCNRDVCAENITSIYQSLIQKGEVKAV